MFKTKYIGHIIAIAQFIALAYLLTDFYNISLKFETIGCCTLSVDIFYGIYFCDSAPHKKIVFVEATFVIKVFLLNIAELIFAIQEN